VKRNKMFESQDWTEEVAEERSALCTSRTLTSPEGRDTNENDSIGASQDMVEAVRQNVSRDKREISRQWPIRGVAEISV
jgi:hypothetical protein